MCDSAALLPCHPDSRWRRTHRCRRSLAAAAYLQGTASVIRNGQQHKVRSLPSPRDVELVKAAFVYKRQLEERSSVLRGMQRCTLDSSASTQVRWGCLVCCLLQRARMRQDGKPII